MIERLFLHIGSPKAASTTIQHYLQQNAAALRARGYSMAGPDLQPSGELGKAIWFFHELRESRPEDARKLISSRLARFPTRNVIISAENLSEPPMASLFADVAKHVRIHLLLVVRRQDEWIYSAWKQWFSKGGLSLDRYIARALREHTPDYPKTIDAWTRVAHQERIRVVSLDFLDGAALNREILDWLEIESREDLIRPLDRTTNESFDFRILDLLARHRGAYDDGHDRKIENFLNRYSKLAQKEKYRLSDKDSSEILQHFRPDNVRLLGAEKTAILEATVKSERRIAKNYEPLAEHDFSVACLYEALGRMADDLSRAHKRIAALERRLWGRFKRAAE